MDNEILNVEFFGIGNLKPGGQICIVTFWNGYQTKEYIALVKGENEQEDIEYTLKMGVPFYHKIVRKGEDEND